MSLLLQALRQIPQPAEPSPTPGRKKSSGRGNDLAPTPKPIDADADDTGTDETSKGAPAAPSTNSSEQVNAASDELARFASLLDRIEAAREIIHHIWDELPSCEFIEASSAEVFAEASTWQADPPADNPVLFDSAGAISTDDLPEPPPPQTAEAVPSTAPEEPTVEDAPAPILPFVISPPPVIVSAPPEVTLRQEIFDLRDHLLSKISLTGYCTLVQIDAGRSVNDAAWLFSLAVALCQSSKTRRETTENDRDAGPSLAAPQRRILLVEAAGEDCGLSRSLAIDCSVGLAELLRPQCPIDACVQPTCHPQIDILGRGGDSLRAIHEQRLTEVWAELQAEYDVVLIAAGPLPWNESIASDASPLNAAELFLALADGVVLTVELNATPTWMAAQAQQELQRRGVNLLGCVVRGLEENA